MDNYIICDFALDRWTPRTLPMARLCQYMERLAVLCGSKESVHFDTVRKGSAISQFSIAPAAWHDVQHRVSLLGDPNAPKDIQSVQRDINKMLQVDDCVGTLRVKGGAVIFQFPGRKTPLVEELLVHEFGEIDGELILVGGKDESIPVWIQGRDGTVSKCWAKKQVARSLAPLIFSVPIRVAGKGKWRRTLEGTWKMEDFEIQSWDELTPDDLAETVSALRTIEGSDWNAMQDPQAELRRMRSDE